MDTLITESSSEQIMRSITLTQFFIAMLSSFTLNLILAKFYSSLNTGYTSSTPVLKTIVLIGLIVTLIMVIIGSNIARAFALVGAMSIVRFRNPLKDPKDLTYIFASIAIGMACGTFFYEYAVIFLIFFLFANYTLKNLSFMKKSENFRVIKVRLNQSNEKDLITLFKKSSIDFKLINSSNFIENDQNILDQVFELRFENEDDFINFKNSIHNEKIYEINIYLGEPESGI